MNPGKSGSQTDPRPYPGTHPHPGPGCLVDGHMCGTQAGKHSATPAPAPGRRKALFEVAAPCGLGLRVSHSTDFWPLTWAWQPGPHCSATWQEPQGTGSSRRCPVHGGAFPCSPCLIPPDPFGLSASEPPKKAFLAGMSRVKGLGFCWGGDKQNANLLKSNTLESLKRPRLSWTREARRNQSWVQICPLYPAHNTTLSLPSLSLIPRL